MSDTDQGSPSPVTAIPTGGPRGAGLMQSHAAAGSRAPCMLGSCCSECMSHVQLPSLTRWYKGSVTRTSVQIAGFFAEGSNSLQVGGAFAVQQSQRCRCSMLLWYLRSRLHVEDPGELWPSASHDCAAFTYFNRQACGRLPETACRPVCSTLHGLIYCSMCKSQCLTWKFWPENGSSKN